MRNTQMVNKMDVTIRARIPESDFKQIEKLVAGRHYLNQSDATRDLVRLGLTVKLEELRLRRGGSDENCA